MSSPKQTVVPMSDESGLDPSVKKKLSGPLEPVELPAGNTVYPSREPVGQFYLLEEGLVGLFRFVNTRKRVLLNKILPGQTMGVTQLLSNDPYPARLIPITDSRALRGNSRHLELLKSNEGDFLNHVLLHENNNHSQGLNNVEAVLSENVRERIARELLELADEVGHRDSRGLVLDVELSRCDISRMVGCSQETASRVMSEFEKREILTTESKRITLRDPGELRGVLGDENAG